MLHYLYVSYPGFETLSLELDPDGKHLAAFGSDAQKSVRIDEKNSLIDVGTIVLRKSTTKSDSNPVEKLFDIKHYETDISDGEKSVHREGRTPEEAQERASESWKELKQEEED